MTKLLMILGLTVLLAAPVTIIADDGPQIPQTTAEGLELLPKVEGLAYVWAEPGVNLSQYKRVNLVEPSVAFKQNWRRDYNKNATSLSNKIKSSDIKRIQKNVAELFVDVFTKELEAGGYTLTTDNAEDVLIVKADILDLDINAPDIPSSGRMDTAVASAGSMSLFMELFDSETNDLLAKALDATADRESMVMQFQSGPANKQAARKMMEPWAKALREGLDHARSATSK
jgi:hypothetical protein